MDTDSEDDIKIVLEPRDRRPRMESNGNHTNEDSEDGEDFVILNGNNPVNASYKKILVESTGRIKCSQNSDEKGQNGSTIGGYKGSSQIGYPSQGYQRNYQVFSNVELKMLRT
jgi:hypothetical protein